MREIRTKSKLRETHWTMVYTIYGKSELNESIKFDGRDIPD